MKPKYKIILALGISGVAATAALADDMNTNEVSTNQLPGTLSSQQFVSDAAVGGLKEIYLSQLALEKSTNDDVKNFASQMVRDHSRADAKLQKIAEAEGLAFPATNTFAADDANWNNALITEAGTMKGGQLLVSTNLPYLNDYRDVQQLKGLSAGQFDQAYVSSLAGDHLATVSEFETASQSLTDEKLKKFAEKTLPTLRKHSEMAQELNSKYNSLPGGTNANSTATSRPM
jgi:putative membrane protein